MGQAGLLIGGDSELKQKFIIQKIGEAIVDYKQIIFHSKLEENLESSVQQITTGLNLNSNLTNGKLSFSYSKNDLNDFIDQTWAKIMKDYEKLKENNKGKEK